MESVTYSPKVHFMVDHSYVIIRTCLFEAGSWALPFMAKEGYTCGMQSRGKPVASHRTSMSIEALYSSLLCGKKLVLFADLCAFALFEWQILRFSLPAPYLMRDSGRLSRSSLCTAIISCWP
jgi:hypothetical protein